MPAPAALDPAPTWALPGPRDLLPLASSGLPAPRWHRHRSDLYSFRFRLPRNFATEISYYDEVLIIYFFDSYF